MCVFLRLLSPRLVHGMCIHALILSSVLTERGCCVLVTVRLSQTLFPQWECGVCIWVCVSDWVIGSPLATALSPLCALTRASTSCSPNVSWWSARAMLSVWLVLYCTVRMTSTVTDALVIQQWQEGVVLNSAGKRWLSGSPPPSDPGDWRRLPWQLPALLLPILSSFRSSSHYSSVTRCTQTSTQDVQSTGAFVKCK